MAADVVGNQKKRSIRLITDPNPAITHTYAPVCTLHHRYDNVTVVNFNDFMPKISVSTHTNTPLEREFFFLLRIVHECQKCLYVIALVCAVAVGLVNTVWLSV